MSGRPLTMPPRSADLASIMRQRSHSTPWMKGEMEPPLGEKIVNGLRMQAFTTEQQARLGVDDDGNRTRPAGDPFYPSGDGLISQMPARGTGSVAGYGGRAAAEQRRMQAAAEVQGPVPAPVEGPSPVDAFAAAVASQADERRKAAAAATAAAAARLAARSQNDPMGKAPPGVTRIVGHPWVTALRTVPEVTWNLPAPGALEEHIVVLMLGGSNIVGAMGECQAVCKNPLPGPAWTVDNAGRVAKRCAEPMHPPDGKGTGIGPGRAFARKFLRDMPGCGIFCVPCALSWGDMTMLAWEPNGLLYSIAVARAKACAQAVGGRIAGVIWHQGEGDACDKDDAEMYECRLQEMIDRLRSDVDDDQLPVVVGEIPDFLNQQSSLKTKEEVLPGEPKWAKEVNQALRKVGARPHTKCIHPADSAHPDKLHFDAQGMEDMGARFAEAWVRLWRQRGRTEKRIGFDGEAVTKVEWLSRYGGLVKGGLAWASAQRWREGMVGELLKGCTVEASGLQGAKDLNGRAGTVVETRGDGRVVVAFPAVGDSAAKTVALKRENLKARAMSYKKTAQEALKADKEDKSGAGPCDIDGRLLKPVAPPVKLQVARDSAAFTPLAADKKRRETQLKPGDWLCPKCDNSNYARRGACNRCQTPKPRDRGDGDDRRDRRRADDARDDDDGGGGKDGDGDRRRRRRDDGETDRDREKERRRREDSEERKDKRDRDEDRDKEKDRDKERDRRARDRSRSKSRDKEKDRDKDRDRRGRDRSQSKSRDKEKDREKERDRRGRDRSRSKSRDRDRRRDRD